MLLLVACDVTMTAEDHWDKGIEAFRGEDLEVALDEFNQAINLDPTVSKYFESRAMIPTETGEWLLAVEDLTKALDLSSPDTEAFGRLTWLRSMRYQSLGYETKACGAFESSAKDFDTWRTSVDVKTLIQTGQQPMVLLFKGGFTLERLNRWDELIALMDEIIELQPTHGNARNQKAWGLNGKGDYEQALKVINEAIEIHPDRESYYGTRSKTYSGLGLDDKAKTDKELVLQMNPNEWRDPDFIKCN